MAGTTWRLHRCRCRSALSAIARAAVRWKRPAGTRRANRSDRRSTGRSTADAAGSGRDAEFRLGTLASQICVESEIECARSELRARRCHRFCGPFRATTGRSSARSIRSASRPARFGGGRRRRAGRARVTSARGSGRKPRGRARCHAGPRSGSAPPRSRKGPRPFDFSAPGRRFVANYTRFLSISCAPAARDALKSAPGRTALDAERTNLRAAASTRIALLRATA